MRRGTSRRNRATKLCFPAYKSYISLPFPLSFSLSLSGTNPCIINARSCALVSRNDVPEVVSLLARSDIALLRNWASKLPRLLLTVTFIELYVTLRKPQGRYYVLTSGLCPDRKSTSPTPPPILSTYPSPFAKRRTFNYMCESIRLTIIAFWRQLCFLTNRLVIIIVRL